jgi:hypothetical protein
MFLSNSVQDSKLESFHDEIDEYNWLFVDVNT